MNRICCTGRALATYLIVIAALAAGAGLWLGGRFMQPKPPPPLQAAILYPIPRPVANFHLTQANGRPLTLADWQGRWTLVFFGYTSCPDVCPTTLIVFKQVWDQLTQQGLTDHVRIDFISVDPARDNPVQLGRYVGFFGKEFIAATGSDEELTRLTRSLGLIYTHAPTDKGDYTVDHSASAAIISPEGELIGLFRPPFNATTLAADLTTLIRQP